MEQFWFDFLSKQLPVIVVLGIGDVVMYKYFTLVISKKDEIIKEKEEENKELYKHLMEINEEMIKVVERNTIAFNIIANK